MVSGRRRAGICPAVGLLLCLLLTAGVSGGGAPKSPSPKHHYKYDAKCKVNATQQAKCDLDPQVPCIMKGGMWNGTNQNLYCGGNTCEKMTVTKDWQVDKGLCGAYGIVKEGQKVCCDKAQLIQENFNLPILNILVNGCEGCTQMVMTLFCSLACDTKQGQFMRPSFPNNVPPSPVHKNFIQVKTVEFNISKAFSDQLWDCCKSANLGGAGLVSKKFPNIKQFLHLFTTHEQNPTVNFRIVPDAHVPPGFDYKFDRPLVKAYPCCNPHWKPFKVPPTEVVCKLAGLPCLWAVSALLSGLTIVVLFMGWRSHRNRDNEFHVLGSRADHYARGGSLDFRSTRSEHDHYSRD